MRQLCYLQNRAVLCRPSRAVFCTEFHLQVLEAGVLETITPEERKRQEVSTRCARAEGTSCRSP